MTDPNPSSPSRRIAAEIRAEAARQCMTQTQMAVAIGVTQMWVSRRLRVDGTVDLTFEDLERFAGVLGVPSGELVARSAWLATR